MKGGILTIGGTVVMNIQQSTIGNITVVAVRGVIKLNESGKQFSGHLQEILETGTGSVLVDLSAVDEVDSTGLGELVAYLQLFLKQGRGLAVVNPTARIRKLFEFMNLDRVLPIYDTVEQGVAVVGQKA
jgi:anti-sigma B factor antagonist